MAQEESHQPIELAEAAVVGGVFLSKGEWATKLAVELKSSDFFNAPLGRVYGLMVEMANRGEAVDEVTLKVACDKAGIDVEDNFAAACSAVANVENTGDHAKLVVEASNRRRIAALGAEMQQRAEQGKPFEVIADIETKMVSLMERAVGRPSVTSLGFEFDQVFEMIDSLQSGDRMGMVATGFDEVDDMIGGLRPSQLAILGAKTSMGKTSMALGIAVHAARQGYPVLFVALEQKPVELATRVAAVEADVNLKHIFNGIIDDDDYERLLEGAEQIRDLPLRFLDKSALAISGLAAEARRMKSSEEGLGLVVVDYLQYMTGRESAENQNIKVGELSRGLKVLARDLDVPVLALAQLSRELDKRADKRPKLSDLRDSGSIEQDADLVMFIYRDEVYNPDDGKWGEAELDIAKHRNGPTGKVDLTWQAHTASFESV